MQSATARRLTLLPHIGIALLVLLGLFLINHLFGFFGHYGYDDMYYASLSAQVLKHNFSLGNEHFNYRWVVIFLTALSYSLFGINDHASALMPILVTLSTAGLVAFCLPDKWQAVASVFLFGLYSWTLFYADKIMPDVYVSFFFFAAIYIVYRQRADDKSLLYGFLFSLSLVLAFLSKETILLTAPIFLCLFVADVIQKRNVKFWTFAIGWGLLLLAIYFIIIKIETGSFFQRFTAIRNGSYFNPCSYDQLPFSETIHRITKGLLFVFIRSGLFFLVAFELVVIIKRPVKSLLKVDTEDDFFSIVLILGLLCSNFMSTSATHYVPMCEDPRHYLFLTPVAAVMAARGAWQFFSNPKPFFWLPVLFFIYYLLGCKHGFENPYLTYLPLCIVTVLAIILSFTKIKLVPAGMFVILAIALAHPIQSFTYSRGEGYKYQKYLVAKNIVQSKDSLLVITNVVAKNYGTYYMGFDTTRVVFKSFSEAEHTAVDPGKKVYLLHDGFSCYLSGKSWDDLPAYAKNVSSYHLVDSAGCAQLYQLQAEDIK